MVKLTISIGENKGADQLRGYREADQRLCFRYTDSTTSLLLTPKISSFWSASVTVHAALCRRGSKHMVGFLIRRLILVVSCIVIYFLPDVWFGILNLIV